jgi:hypothetical protein
MTCTSRTYSRHLKMSFITLLIFPSVERIDGCAEFLADFSRAFLFTAFRLANKPTSFSDNTYLVYHFSLVMTELRKGGTSTFSQKRNPLAYAMSYSHSLPLRKLSFAHLLYSLRAYVYLDRIDICGRFMLRLGVLSAAFSLCFPTLFNLHQLPTPLHHLALGTPNGLDGTISRSPQYHLRLHSLEHHNRLALLYPLANSKTDIDNEIENGSAQCTPRQRVCICTEYFCPRRRAA